MFGEFSPKLQGVKSNAIATNTVTSIIGSNGVLASNPAGNVTLSLNYNTDNLQLTASQINTIQDISSTASPTFGGLFINGSVTFDANNIINTNAMQYTGTLNITSNAQAGVELNHAFVVSANSTYVYAQSIVPSFTMAFSTLVNAIGCYVGIGGQAGSSITNGFGIYIEEPAFGTNKYAANLKGRVTIGTTGQFDISRLGVVTAGTWNGSSIATTYTDAKVTSIGGTSNRITVGGTSTVPTIDISSAYVGQSTITTLGTIATGTWQGTVIGGSFLNYNTTNLKVTASQINTIQDIATSSTPVFTKIGTISSPVVEMHAKLSAGDPIVAVQNGGNSIFGMQSDSDSGLRLGVYSGGNITNQVYISKIGNVGLFASPSAGGGTSVLFIANSAGIPGSNPTAGYIIYSQSGALKGRGTSGTVTTIGNADPHCPVCGSDFAVQWENDFYGGELRVCKICEIDYICQNHRMMKALSDHVLGNATAITADEITNFYASDPAYFLWNSERTDEYRGVRMPAIETR
jgi:hypothetical protein